MNRVMPLVASLCLMLAIVTAPASRAEKSVNPQSHM
jgi:hypothetical protein